MTNARFSILQSRAVSDKRVSNPQFRTLAALGIFGDKEGWCFPKLKVLGEMLGKSRQAVSKDIQALVELGYVEVTKKYREDGSRTNNLYRLMFDPRQSVVDTPQYVVDVPSTSEVDTPSTSEVDALTPHINDPSKKAKRKKRVLMERDKRLDHPSIMVYKSLARLNIPIAWRDEVINTVDGKTEEWSIIIKSWIGRGWKPGNVSGMLDVFKKEYGNHLDRQVVQMILPSGEITETLT